MSKGNGVLTTTYAEGFRRPPTALVFFCKKCFYQNMVKLFSKKKTKVVEG